MNIITAAQDGRKPDHELKVWPEYFEALRDGRKTFEWRKDDRGFAEGQTLLLNEFDPNGRGYTGRALRFTVSYVMRAGFGLPPGYCVLALAAGYATPAARALRGLQP